jgi:hypothetical protein
MIPMRITPALAGFLIGAMAALWQVLFRVYPPPAYGICIACHSRDLVNWLVNFSAGLNLGVAPVSLEAPVLTTVGVILGALVSSFSMGEFKFKVTENPVKCAFYGFMVMISALLLGACPIRTLLRVAYGDVLAVFGWLSIMLGVIVGAEIIKWDARKDLRIEERGENAV